MDVVLVAVVCRRKKRRVRMKSQFLTSLVALLMALVFASGCSNRATATISPGADLNRVKTLYVVHQPKDTHNIHNLIRDKLTKDGFTTTAGPELPQSSYQADSIRSEERRVGK